MSRLTVRETPRFTRTDDEETYNVKPFLVEDADAEQADERVSWVEWSGVELWRGILECRRCHSRMLVERPCDHVLAVHDHLGFER